MAAANSTVTVTAGNGTDSVSVDITLDGTGSGTGTLNFGALDDATDTLSIAQDDILTVSFTDSLSSTISDTAEVTSGVAGDTNGDGKAYVYATSATIDFAIGTDYTTVGEWSTGSTLNDNFTADATYSPVYSVTSGTGWGVDAAALAFSGFTAGFASSYINFHFKINTAYTTIFVKFPGATTEEKEYTINTFTDLGNGWWDISIPMSDFGTVSSTTEFAVHNNNSGSAGSFLITDIYFE